jgi:hypothetical protein
MTEKTEFEKARTTAQWFGGVVYVGVVVAASTLFISFILTAFPTDAYLSRFVMVVAGMLIGGSMLAFPVALHNWAISGRHRAVTTALYYGEMMIIAVNTIVAFGSLLAKYTGYQMPEWAILYEPFSVGSIVYTLAAWGTVFLLDPQAKAKAQELESEQNFITRVAQKKLEFLDSQEGEDAVMAVAQADIAEQFRPDRFTKVRKRFGSGKPHQPIPVDPDKPFEVRQSTTEAPGLGDKFRPEA